MRSPAWFAYPGPLVRAPIPPPRRGGREIRGAIRPGDRRLRHRVAAGRPRCGRSGPCSLHRPRSSRRRPRPSKAPVTVIPGTVLNANPGYQRINISGSGSGSVFAAYGKTSDVDAWVGDSAHTTLRYDADKSELVGRKTGSATSVPDPRGSDLWYQEWGTTRGSSPSACPKDVSMVVVSDGKSAAPSDVSVTWPSDTATPSVGPLMTAGTVFVLGGIVLLVWAFLHQRRSRGSSGVVAAAGRDPRACVPRAGPPLPARRSRPGRVAAAGPSSPSRSSSSPPWASRASRPSTGRRSGAPPRRPRPRLPRPPGRRAGRAHRRHAPADQPRRQRVARRDEDRRRQGSPRSRRPGSPARPSSSARRTTRSATRTRTAGTARVSAPDTVALPQQIDSGRAPSSPSVGPRRQKTSPRQSPGAGVRAGPLQGQTTCRWKPRRSSPRSPRPIGAAQLGPDSSCSRSPGPGRDRLRRHPSKDTDTDPAALFRTDGDDLRAKIGKHYKARSASLPETA